MNLIQSVANQRVVGRAYLSADHISKATGLDPAIVISKNGGAFAQSEAGTSVMVEIEDTAWYFFTLVAADVNTLGPLIIKATHAGMDDIEIIYQVIAPVLVAPTVEEIRLEMEAAGYTLAAIRAQTDYIGALVEYSGHVVTVVSTTVFTVTGSVPLVDGLWNGLPCFIDTVDGEDTITLNKKIISYTYADGVGTVTIEANSVPIIGGAPFLVWKKLSGLSVEDMTALKGMLEAESSSLALIKSKTDNLPAAPAAIGSAMTLTAAYDAAKVAASAEALNSLFDAVAVIYNLVIANGSGDLAAIKLAATTLVTRLTEARAGYLNKLDVTGVLAHTDNADTFKATSVTVNDKTGFILATTPPTAAQIKTELEQAGSHLAWLKDVQEGDCYIDTTDATQYQLVVCKKGDTTTEYIRKNLKDIEDAPIVDNTTAIGAHTEPL